MEMGAVPDKWVVGWIELFIHLSINYWTILFYILLNYLSVTINL